MPIGLNSGGAWTNDPAQTVLTLDEPTPIGELVDELADADLEPVEYRATDVDAEPLQADPDVIAQMESSDDEPFVFPGVNVIYEPRGTPLEAQAQELALLYGCHDITGTPMITSRSVVGPISGDDLGDLANAAPIAGILASPLSCDRGGATGDDQVAL